MQNERKPDIMGADSEALEEKVREMMDPKAKPSDLVPDKTPEIDEVGTAPEVMGLPVSKGPLKIKIIKSDPVDEDAAGPPSVELQDTSKAKKKITVKHDETEPANDADVIPAELSPEESIQIPEDTEGIVEAKDPAVIIPDTTETAEPAPELITAETTEEEPLEAQPTPNQEVEEEIPLPPVIEDNKTKEAVEEIVAHDSDELLAAQDEKKAAFQPPKKPGTSRRLRNFLGAWWHSPKARWLTLTVLFLALAAAATVPTSRYFLLNSASIRSSLSVQVLDNSTQQPLKNVKVSLGNVSGMTDTDGRVKLPKIKLGPATVKIEKRAFAPIEQPVTIGWGSNPLGEFKLVPTGTQYAFVTTDYLSASGIENIEASSGEANASSDKNGKILLTIEQPADEFEVLIKGAGFREEKIKLSADLKSEQAVKLVPERKDVFISKRSGIYDVYKIDIDGKNEEKILIGTGSERDDVLLLPHPAEEVVAIVSTRGNERNKDGFLLSSLTIVDLSDNSSIAPAQSEQIRLLGWIGERLIYMQATEGASAANPKRQRLMSYNFKTDDNKELFTSNYFNDLGVVGTKIYFAPSGAYQASSIGLFSLDADGTNRQTITPLEVWSITRTSFERLSLSSGQDWYDFKLGDKTPAKLPGQPANLTSRAYVDSPDGKKSLWVDNRDGKGVLLAYEPSTQNEQILRTQSGLKYPVRWLSNEVIVYRIHTEQETADYALSLRGGEPQKIRDVTHTSGTDTWYYY